MTTILELFSRLRTLGVNISLEGEALKVSAPKGAITAELRQEITARKPEMVSFLRTLLRTARSSELSIARRDPASTVPLSSSQQRLWFLHHLDDGRASYNIPAVLRMTGSLDVAALEKAVQNIIVRHENLRTRFIEQDGQPAAVIDKELSWNLEQLDLRNLDSSERDSFSMSRAAEFIRKPFDLSKESPLRVLLITIEADNHLLVASMHHIISDGWSMGVMVRELTEHYLAAKNGTTARMAPLAVQYADFAQWQQKWLESGELDRQLPYWRSSLADAPPMATFPTDFARPPAEGSKGRRSRILIPKPLVAELEKLSREQNVTLFMLLFAAFLVLLYRYTGQEDLVVGTPSANRNRSELHPIIGFFVNNLVMRAKLDGNPTFVELLARIREVTLGAYDHQDVPFEKLVQALRPVRALDHSPLFQTMFSFQNFPFDDLELPGLTISPVEMDCGTARFDLTVEIYPRNGEMHAFFEYKTDLYLPETIVALQRHFISLLESVVARPGQHINSIPMMSGEEQKALVLTSNQRDVFVSDSECFHRQFERNADKYPDRVAVTAGGRALTYRELNLRANQVAHSLTSIGAGPGTIVGICVDRSVDMLAGLLGIMKSGAAYVPLDPIYPRKRITSILEDAQPAALITTTSLQDLLTESTARMIYMDTLQVPQSGEFENPVLSVDAQSPCYVIFTSGSTGRPKGVQISHGSLMNFLESMSREPGLMPDDVLLAVTTISFDIAALELYLPLYVGASLHIATRTSDPSSLLEDLSSVKPSVMQGTPATWQLLLSAGWNGDDDLKILCGGEALTGDLGRALLTKCASLWNMYGPTETTIWSAVSKVTNCADSTIPIGPPIANTSFYVLDQGRNVVPIGAAGELYIGGEGVALGYLNRPDLTGERFVPNPFNSADGDRLYRTGDLVRLRRDGQIEFLGRIDHQIKLRGFRIELGEIESCLRAQAGVKDAVVLLRQDPSNPHLAAYVAVDGAGNAPTQSDLSDALRLSLPQYMIPASIVIMDEFPRTPNGKLDRSALPVAGQPTSMAEFVEPRTEEEQTISEVFSTLLNLEKISTRDNFFDIGAHSLLIAKAHDTLKKRLDPDLQIISFFQHPTIESLARSISDRRDQPVPMGTRKVEVQ